MSNPETVPTSDPPSPRVEGDPPIHWHESIGSTNTEALRLGEEGAPHKSVVVARHQTAGRGKLQAKWFMPPGEGVLISILLREMPQGVAFGQLTLEAGWRIAQWLGEETGLTIAVKKPNDLIIDGKKLAGILSEARWRGETLLYAVVGIGINANVKEFPEGLDTPPISLALAAGRDFDIEMVARSLIAHLRSW